MNKYILSLIEKLIGKIKISSKYSVAIAVLLTTIIYVMSPSLFGNCYIRVPPSRLICKLPKQFNSCYIKFRNKIHAIHYGVSLEPNNNKEPNIIFYPLNKEIEFLEITNSLGDKAIQENFNNYMISASFKTVLPIEIIEVNVDGSTQELKKFLENNIMSYGATYVDKEYIREDISTFLLRYNDQVSNYLLTGMFLALIPLTVHMFRLQIRLYLYSNKIFTGYISQKFGLSNSCSKNDILIAADKYANYYISQNSWFRFLQIMGPAIGFTLTVSSLIASLHPITQNTKEITGFMAGMHIAMISTLLGLLTRIIGTVCQRVNDKLLSRADETFSSISEGNYQQ